MFILGHLDCYNTHSLIDKYLCVTILEAMKSKVLALFDA